MIVASPSEFHWTEEKVRRFWTFENSHPENFFSFQVGAVLRARFKKYLTGAVADYGAGGGFLVDDLLAAGLQCGAVEYDADRVRALTEQFRGRRGFLGARQSDTLMDWKGSFQAALLIEVVEHLYDADLDLVFENIKQMLKSNGYLVVTTPNDEDRSKNFICNPETGQIFHRWQHVRSWSQQTLPAYIEAHGFACVEHGTTDFGASIRAMRRTMPAPIRVARAIAKSMIGQHPHLYAVFRVNP